MSWGVYVAYLWWQLAWIMEHAPEEQGGIAPPSTRQERLVADFEQGEDGEAGRCPGYEREALPSVTELRDNFVAFFQHEVGEFRRHCVQHESWDGPFTWLPASMLELDASDQRTVLCGIRYKREVTVFQSTKLLFAGSNPDA